MIKVTISMDTSALTARLRKKQTALAKLPKEGYTEFVRLTPIGRPKTWKNPKPPKHYVPGNAKHSTKLENNQTIVGDYPYAQRLDKGWSKQAPKGILEPFTKWWLAQLKRIARI